MTASLDEIQRERFFERGRRMTRRRADRCAAIIERARRARPLIHITATSAIEA